MLTIARMSADLAKNLIQVQAVDATGRKVVAEAIKREQFFTWCEQLPWPQAGPIDGNGLGAIATPLGLLSLPTCRYAIGRNEEKLSEREIGDLNVCRKQMGSHVVSCFSSGNSSPALVVDLDKYLFGIDVLGNQAS